MGENMVNLKQRYAFPRVSTRGRYDQRTGLIKKGKPRLMKTMKQDYFLYPKYKIDKIAMGEEVVIFVHGMRNSRWGAIHGARLLRNKLRKLGYKYPVIAFSYDAEVRGAHKLDKPHKPELYQKILGTAFKIAKYNGIYNLTNFIFDLRDKNRNIKIRLVGHSLGCDVISHIQVPVESIHLFASPVEADRVIGISEISGKTTNYFNPNDEVIKEGVGKGVSKMPSCLISDLKTYGGYLKTKRCYAKDHRFKSHIEKLRKFP